MEVTQTTQLPNDLQMTGCAYRDFDKGIFAPLLTGCSASSIVMSSPSIPERSLRLVCLLWWPERQQRIPRIQTGMQLPLGKQFELTEVSLSEFCNTELRHCLALAFLESSLSSPSSLTFASSHSSFPLLHVLLSRRGGQRLSRSGGCKPSAWQSQQADMRCHISGGHADGSGMQRWSGCNVSGSNSHVKGEPQPQSTHVLNVICFASRSYDFETRAVAKLLKGHLKPVVALR
jgi:hypothetical protein